jgi:hypothetical protein
MVWSHFTGRVDEGKEQNDINETHDEITIIATDINDNTAKHPEEHGHLRNSIEFLYRCSKMMVWVDWSVGGR